MGKQKSGDEAQIEHPEPNPLQYVRNKQENQFISTLYRSSRFSISSPTKKQKNKLQNLLILDQNNQQDEITIYRVIISRKKNYQMMTLSQIQNYGQNISQILQNKGSYHFFNYFPNQILPAVTQFTGCHFSPRRMMLNSSIKQISQIKFINLVELYLADQLLYSVEGLSFLNAPKLIKLSIKRNKITTLNTLVKGQFPNLEQLQFYLNPINSMQNLYRFHPKSFRYLICFNRQQSLNLINENRISFKSQYEGERYAVMHNKIELYYGSDYKFLKQLVW